MALHAHRIFARDGSQTLFRRRAGVKISPRAVSWLTFSRACTGDADSETLLSAWNSISMNQFSAKAEQCSLLGPVGWQPRRQPHQFLGVELWRLPAVDDGRGDVRREPGKAQQDIDVGCRTRSSRAISCTVSLCLRAGALGCRERARRFASGPYRLSLLSLESSTSIFISRPTRFSRTGAVNVRTSSGGSIGLFAACPRHLNWN